MCSRRARCLCSSSWKRRTESRMFGRSKPRTSTTGSRSPSRSTISSRTGGAAVAVSATIVGRPSASAAAPRRRYSGRKSCPHSEMQCASSTTSSDGWATASSSSTSGLASCSGARKTNSSASSASSASAASRSAARTVELSCAAPPAARARRSSTCSRWSAISGDTTTVAPGRQQAGDLVDGRLARAGGHHHERVAAGQHGLDRLALAGAQRLVPEGLARDPIDPDPWRRPSPRPFPGARRGRR